MKKTPDKNEKRPKNEEILKEYQLDYSTAKPNRFALEDNQQIIILDPDVAKYFKSSESVNRVLRALITTMP